MNLFLKMVMVICSILLFLFVGAFLTAQCDGCWDPAMEMALQALKSQRTWKWVHLGGHEWCCSACGEIEHTEGSWEHPLRDREWKYCHACGARMVEK